MQPRFKELKQGSQELCETVTSVYSFTSLPFLVSFFLSIHLISSYFYMSSACVLSFFSLQTDSIDYQFCVLLFKVYSGQQTALCYNSTFLEDVYSFAHF